MTFKQFLLGLQSLRAVSPALAFFGAALVLVAMPRRWSAAAAPAVLLFAGFFGLLMMLVGDPPKLPERTDLVIDRLSVLTPIWLTILLPVMAACVLRSESPSRGLAAAGVMLSFGGLSFAAAARTISLLYVALTIAVAGAAASGASSEPDQRGNQFFARSCVAMLLLWGLFSVGLLVSSTNAPAIEHQSPNSPILQPPSRMVGVALTSIAILGLLGAAPWSLWLSRGPVGPVANVRTLQLLTGCLAYLKLRPTVGSSEVQSIVWVLALGSAAFSVWSTMRRSTANAAFSAVSLIASIAGGVLLVDPGLEPSPRSTGALALLLSLSLASPSLSAALAACQINTAGSLGRPQGGRGLGLRLALYLLLGLPLSFGFWAWWTVMMSPPEVGGIAGKRQVAVGLGTVAVVFVGLRFLYLWARLKERPALQPTDEDRWQVAASIYGAAILITIGCWPRPIFAALGDLLTVAAPEMPVAPLKP